MVITRTNANGEEEQAIAWVPADENWALAEDAGPPLERTAADGTKELGVKYYRTDENGNQELIVKWEPVVSPEQGAVILAATSIAAVPTERQVAQPPVETQADPTTPVVETAAVAGMKPEHVEEMEKGHAGLTDDFRTHDELGESDEHLVVVRGNNMLELPVGHYVVAGAFEEFQHAEDYSDELFEKGYHDVIVGYITARGYYYVVTYRSDNLDAINAEKERERKRPGMSKVWVLHVKAQ